MIIVGVIRKEVQLFEMVLRILAKLTFVSDPSLGFYLFIYLISIWQSLEGSDRSDILQKNIGFLLRVFWMDATGQSEFNASAGLVQVQGRMLALARRRDDILCQRRGHPVRRLN